MTVPGHTLAGQQMGQLSPALAGSAASAASPGMPMGGMGGGGMGGMGGGKQGSEREPQIWMQADPGAWGEDGESEAKPVLGRE